MVCVHFMVHSVNATVVPSNNLINREPYSKVHSKETVTLTSIRQRSGRRRRFRKERRLIEQPADICAEIVGPTWQVNKTGEGPCQQLVVWVPKKDGFTEFVKIENSEVKGGFSLAIFCNALQFLPYRVQPIFKPYVNYTGYSNGSYDELLHVIEGTTCEMVAGDVTVRSSRGQYVDFTTPYLSSEVYMLVHGSLAWSQTLWTFLRPFTKRLWFAIVGMCIYIGVAVSILEYRADNPKFTASYKTIRMIIWFPVSTFFFNEGKIVNRNSKVVLVMWLSMIFIVVQIFTATLSSWLTLDQLRPKLPSNYESVGYQDGSFLRDFIKNKYMCNDTNLVALHSAEEYKTALSSGNVTAVFDELPYIELFLAKYGSDYTKFGPINQESGIAFAFPLGSPMLQNFTRAVINVTESDVLMEMKKKYLGFHAPDESQPNQTLPKSLDIQSFIGLFILMGTASIAAIMCSEISLRRANKKVLPASLDD
ncbi:glutamate receptor 2.5-like [Rutidosis leptorrhynchoides]|uniref:glutamate receptor 2.5-like n=1 Tax=Rutidosis leptorrhynchoides TaxID=125765 RepID=UPI003A98E555